MAIKIAFGLNCKNARVIGQDELGDILLSALAALQIFQKA
jgi:hypothetical protein